VQEEELIEDRFGRAVRRLRDDYGWSQPELARAFAEAGGTPRNATGITRLERGSRRVSLGEAVILARVLGSTVDEMLGER
jgi:transcriptional regulator with XRE-family HTH domain